MRNEFKNNPLACGLLGIIIGAGSTLGGQALLDDDSTKNQEKHISRKQGSNFDIVPYDEDGDVYITAHGKKYHAESCYTLNRSKKIQRVNSEDAEEAGLGPCSKCQ